MTKSSKLPAPEYLHTILDYDQTTGDLRWKVSRGRWARIGNPAGTIEKSGHISIKIDGRNFKAHRIAWIMHYGSQPDGDLDHINRVPSDNRISNLRCATRSENLINTGLRKDNNSGCTGVHYHAKEKKWRVTLKFGGVTYRLGAFSNIEDAKAVRKAAEQKYHTSKPIKENME